MLSVGEILKKTREQKGLTLLQIEKEIKIRTKFLQAVEENNWNVFTSKIYVTGMIKNYAQFLGLDETKMLAFFRREYERTEEIRFKKRIASSYLTPQTKKIATIGLIFLFAVFGVYFGYQIKQYLTPPVVMITSPIEGKTGNKEKITIHGKTEKEAVITIFGERVYQNKNGEFIYDFPLKEGKNELIIEVTGANGKKTILKKMFTR